jgi:hypothetical protein
MVVVVADAILEPSRRSRRLNASDQAFGNQNAKRVVHRLQRDGADLGADDVSDALSRDVRLTGDRAQDGESLRGDVDAALTKQFSRVDGHRWRAYQIFE